jgi:tetratricopeptide (TPR) repeat protein
VSAEEVVLASGTRYQATKVEVDEAARRVRFTYPAGGGSATVSVAFDRLDAKSLFALVVARTPADAPGAQLALAAFALDRGLPSEAADRYRRAAEMDPALAAERDAGLAAVAEAEARRVLGTAEAEMRRGRYAGAIERAEQAVALAGPTSTTAVKAKGVVELATKLLARDRVRTEAEAKAKVDATAAAEEAAFRTALDDADAKILRAVDRRDRVANPSLSRSRVVEELETADVLLREGRRLLERARDLAGDRADDVVKRDREALSILVANHLDLADLYRQQGRFEKARARARSALILDPQSDRARDVQDRIEEDLRTPPYEPFVEEPFSSVTYYAGYPYLTTPRRYPFGYRCPCVRPFPHSAWGGGGSGWRFFVRW